MIAQLHGFTVLDTFAAVELILPCSDYVHSVNWGQHPLLQVVLLLLEPAEHLQRVLSKIFALSSAVSHGMLSIFGFTSSYHLPVRGSVFEPAPGRSVPNRQRSGPQMRNNSFNDSMLYSAVSK